MEGEKAVEPHLKPRTSTDTPIGSDPTPLDEGVDVDEGAMILRWDAACGERDDILAPCLGSCGPSAPPPSTVPDIDPPDSGFSLSMLPLPLPARFPLLEYVPDDEALSTLEDLRVGASALATLKGIVLGGG